MAGFYWRYSYNMSEFFEKLCKPYFSQIPSLNLIFFHYFQPYIMVLRAKMHGIGRHSLSEIAQFSFKDLDALSILLGDKHFFSGDIPATIGNSNFWFMISPLKHG